MGALGQPASQPANNGAPCEPWIASAQQQCDSNPPPYVLARLEPHARELHTTCPDAKSQPALAQLDACVSRQIAAATAARDAGIVARRGHGANPASSGHALRIEIAGVTDGLSGEARLPPSCGATQPASAFEVRIDGAQLCVTATTYLVTPVTRGPVAMNPRGFIVATDTAKSSMMIESDGHPQRVGDCTYDNAGNVEPVVLWQTSTKACGPNTGVVTAGSHLVRVLDAASGAELVGWQIDG
jgi:hypothetical protein